MNPNYHKPNERIETKLSPRLSAMIEDVPKINDELKENADFLIKNATDPGVKSLMQLRGLHTIRHHYFDAMSAAANFVEGTKQQRPEVQAVLIKTYREALDLATRAFFEHEGKNPGASPKIPETFSEFSILVKNASGSNEVGFRDPSYRSQSKGNPDDAGRARTTVLRAQQVVVGELRPPAERTQYDPNSLEQSVAQTLALFERINEIAKNSMPPKNLKSTTNYRELDKAFSRQNEILKALNITADTLNNLMAATDVRPVLGETLDKKQQREAQEKQKRSKEQLSIAKNSTGFIAQTIQTLNRLYGVRVMPTAEKYTDNNLS